MTSNSAKLYFSLVLLLVFKKKITLPILKNTLPGCFRHCMKSVRIRSFSGPHFPAFGLNTETNIYSVNLRIYFEWWKMRTRKSPDEYTFYAVRILP